eukprot:COSAG01_NODE_36034_length_523_cov_1.174528_1_plen_42_part_00
MLSAGEHLPMHLPTWPEEEIPAFLQRILVTVLGTVDPELLQ